MISRISIKNFRSLSKVDIDANWITSLVGENDAGKSNVLRALNLFFNGETDHNEPFDFSRDFNQFSATVANKAPQIEIVITFELPGGYIKEGQPESVEWKKVWRSEGEVRRLERKKFGSLKEFPPRSKIPALLDRVQFTYVPAIKDKAFFKDLQGKLYDVLSSVAEKPLKASAGDFQQQLGNQLQDLLETLKDTFKSDADMRLPENLREIFESLEINSDDVPLSRRGDGIKVRHIPMMLKFISEKRDSLLNKGGVRYTHIWGFEEPENNVEMSAAFKMVDDFLDVIADSDRHQLLMTTHSPIYYRLDQHREEAGEWLTTFFVSKIGKETLIETREPEEVDESMGLMPIVAPYVAQAKARHDEMNAELEKIQDVVSQRLPTVFVEGESDRIVLSRAWSLFSEFSPDRVRFCAGDGAYGSANAIHSRALAWLLTMRHRPTPDRVKAAAVFDADASGTEARTALGKDMTRFNMGSLGFKSVPLKPSSKIIELKKLGFQIDIDLEALYSGELWQKACEKGWIEERDDVSSILSKKQINDMAAGKPSPFANLESDDEQRLKFRFTDSGKKAASNFIEKQKDDLAIVYLGNFQKTINDIEKHLF